MVYYSGNPVDDAIDHHNQEDNSDDKYEYPHHCVCCEKGFDKGLGVRIGDDKFFNECVKSGQHFEYFRNKGLTDKEIWQLTEEETKDI